MIANLMEVQECAQSVYLYKKHQCTHAIQSMFPINFNVRIISKMINEIVYAGQCHSKATI